MASSSVPVKELKAIWYNKQLDSGSKLQLSRKLLAERKLGEYRKLHTNKMLVHPANRGGRMLGHHDVHYKGHAMLQAGARLDKISDADCIGKSRDPSKSAEQVAANEKLVEASAGCLAPVRGEETHLSMGCGHTAAFTRAVNATCKTPLPELGGATGFLSLDGILAGKSNREEHPFRIMCEEGWEWFVIDPDVEVAFPELPGLWQSALNASHAVAGQPLEVETASFIAQRLEHGASLKEAQEAAEASGPNCLKYLDAIVHFVAVHGGGSPSFPIIRYLDAFAKTYGKSIVLGEEFVRTVAYTSFSDDLKSLHSLLRAALLVGQLTSPKVQDGFGKMLTRSDVEKLRHKDY